MKPIGFNGRLFSSLGVDGSFFIDGLAGPSMQPVEIDRSNAAPLVTGMRQSSRLMTIHFNVLPASDPDYIDQAVTVTISQLLAVLDPGNKTARTLVATYSVEDTTEFQVSARVGQYRPGPNWVDVDFVIADDRWLERTDTTTSSLSVSAAAVIPLENRGGATADLTLKLGWSANKSGNYYKYRRTVDVTNNGDRIWKRVRLTLDLGDTAALVTGGKAQADGDDIRIRRGRRELARTLTNVNTKRTFAHIFDTIAAGETATYEMWYGNPGASSPQTLSVRTLNGDDYAADDLEGSSGTATAGAAGTLTDAGQSWETDRWAGGFLQIVSGLGSGKRRRITSNTATVITVARNWGGSNVDNTSVYVIWNSGIAVWGGLATTAGSTSTLTDSSQSFNTNELVDASLYNVTKGIGPFTVRSNTATVITINGTMTAPASSDVYYLERWGALHYFVDTTVFETAHRGLWRTNSYHSKGGQIWYGDVVPGGWVPWLMLDNQDDFAQGRIVDEGSGGGHAINNWPGQYARRGVRSENTWPEKKQADGVALYDPRGFLGFNWTYRMKNEHGIGIVELRTQEADGDSWGVPASDSTTRSTLTAVNSSGAAGYTDFSQDDSVPVRIWTGVLPVDDDESIPATVRKDESIELRDNTKRRAYLSNDDCGGLTGGVWVIGAEAAIYDFQAVARLGGGPSSEAPYTKVTAGPRFALASGQELWVNGDPQSGKPLFGIYTSNALTSRAPWAGIIRDYALDLDGNGGDKIPSRLLPLPPGNLVRYPDSATGWTLTNGAGVTSVLATSSSTTRLPGHDTSITVSVSAAPVGAWTITLLGAWFAVTPDTLYEFGYWALRSGSFSGSVVHSMKVEWADAANVSNSADPDQTISSTMASNSVWYPNGSGRHIYAGPPIDGVTASSPGATTQSRITLTLTGTNLGGAATWRIGTVMLGGKNLYLDETGIGTLTARASWRESVYS